MHLHDRLRPGLDRISAPAPTAHLTKSEGRMSESKFLILGGRMVAGYSAWSNRFEAGRVGNSIGGYRPWNHPASQIMDVSEFCTVRGRAPVTTISLSKRNSSPDFRRSHLHFGSTQL